MTGEPAVDYKKIKLAFGEYVQVFNDPEPTNTQAPRTIGAIAMCAARSRSGYYRFMSLQTGRIITRRKFTSIPITQDVITRVHDLAEAEKQPLIHDCPVFEWSKNIPIADIPDGEEGQTNINDDDFIPIGPINDLTVDTSELDDDETSQQSLEGDADPGPIEEMIHNGEHDMIHGDGNITENDIDRVHDIDQSADVIHAQRDASSDDYSESSVDTNEESSESSSDESESSEDSDNEGGVDRNTHIVEEHTRPALEDQKNKERMEDIDTESEERDIKNKDREATDAQTAGPDQTNGDNVSNKRYDLRPQRQRTYSHRLANQMDNPESTKSYHTDLSMFNIGSSSAWSAETRGDVDIQLLQTHLRDMQEGTTTNVKKVFEDVCHFIFTQMTADKGIDTYGQRAVDALLKEFAQLDDMTVFDGLFAHNLTKEQKRAALRSINLIKEKRCGKIKGRSVADGRKQRKIYSKSDITSPTVSNDALMMSLAIDAKEGRFVGTADVPGAYLQTPNDEFVVLKMTGESVKVLCKLNPKYEKFVVIENGVLTIYLQLLKALYGCIKSAMIWYNLFRGTLEKLGFKINPYDPCVANKMINGKQCTICWYVDDLKISHMEEQVVMDMLAEIESKFEGKFTITTGLEHIYLGMNIVFNPENGTFTVSMKDYIQEAIDAFDGDIISSRPTPATKTLFEINVDSPKANDVQREMFQHIVAKLLYVSQRCRLDIQLAIGFLCTRVSKTTQQDIRKLKRLLQYLYGTRDEKLTLGADTVMKMETWVDASYAVHHDMKSHTGGVITLGTGAIMSKSSKQKLNTKSSTEAELVGASDYTPNAIWAAKFLDAQGYTLTSNTLHQDNQSAMRLEQNGRRSCGKQSRHIDIRYFYLKDLIQRGEIVLKYCPTENMVADFFTKPLQGNLFTKLKAVIMGQAPYTSLDTLGPPGSSKERVGRDDVGRTTDDRTRTDRKTNITKPR